MNVIAKKLFENAFDENYQSVIVLANPKTVLNVKYASKDVKEQIVRADQLVNKIKFWDAKCGDVELSQKAMLEVANSILDKNVEVRSDYVKKYEELLDKMEAEKASVEEVIVEEERVADNREESIKRLKVFRLEQSRKEKIKPYYIFNDAQMEDIIAKNPQTKEEMLQVSGFGNVKMEK